MIDKNIFNKLPNRVKNNEILKKMLLIRAAEFAFVELSKLGKIRGPLHTSVGQEAVAVSVCCNLKKKIAYSAITGVMDIIWLKMAAYPNLYWSFWDYPTAVVEAWVAQCMLLN